MFYNMKILVLIAIVFMGYVSCDEVSGGPQPVPPETTTMAPNTTVPSTSTSEVTKSSTSTSTTTTTTPQPTTTAATPNTTTTSTTTPATNTTTTSTTTTPPPTTTTPAPSPSPVPPEKGEWTVKDKNVTCIIVDMAIQINVTYSKLGNMTGFALIDVPANSSNATGLCGNSTQVLELMWSPTSNLNFTNLLNLTFSRNTTEKKFMLSNIALTLQIDPKNFPNADTNETQIFLQNNEVLFTTSLTKSYRCAKLQNVQLIGKNSNETSGWLKISHVQLEAFHESNSADFGAVEDCESSSSTDIVPIAVGCALVGLVAIVLISYLVGRRRSQARGYLSM